MSGMSLSLVKAELKKRGLPVKEKKASLMARLIVVLKQTEKLSRRVPKWKFGIDYYSSYTSFTPRQRVCRIN